MNKIFNLVLIISGLCYSCTYDHQSAEPKLPDTVSFQQHIIPLFNNHCNTTGCHSGQNAAANLNLEPQNAYKQLINKNMLNLAQPSNSLLYFQMTSTSEPMPPSGNLDSSSLKLVLKWITQGGKNN